MQLIWDLAKHLFLAKTSYFEQKLKNNINFCLHGIPRIVGVLIFLSFD